jgi:hypothetical protein
MKRATLMMAVLAVLLGGVRQARAGPITFNFEFDNARLDFSRPDGTFIPPAIGTGTVTINNNPGLGTFTLASLGAFSMSFTFDDGNKFTQADIDSNPSLSEVVIEPFGAGERLYFSDTGSGGGGSAAGALDLINAGGSVLSFEPSFAGGHILYKESSLSGDYLGLAPSTTSTPEPPTLTLLGIGSLGLLGYGWRRRKQVAA